MGLFDLVFGRGKPQDEEEKKRKSRLSEKSRVSEAEITEDEYDVY